jgi:predicted RNase H-like HicB family nuclease
MVDRRRDGGEELGQPHAVAWVWRGRLGGLSLWVHMRTYTAVIERDADTGLLVGYVPGWPGAHSQGATIEELRENLREVIGMLLEDGEPKLEAEFVGTETLRVA